jgi:hypothetical protein
MNHLKAKITLNQEQATVIFDLILTHLECNEGLFQNEDGLYNTDWQVVNKLIEAGFDVPRNFRGSLANLDRGQMERGGE